MSGLRLATLVAVVCGHLAAVAATVLPVAALLVSVPLVVAGAVVTSRASDRSAARLRAGATLVAVGLALVVLPRVVSGGGEAGPRGVLGPLLVGVSVAQAFTWVRRRELSGGLLSALGLLVLGASFAPDVLVGLPLLAGWVAVVTAVVLADRERVADGVDVTLAAGSPRGPVVTAAALAAVLGLAGFLLVPVPEDAGLRSRLAAQAQAQQFSGRGVPGAYTGTRVDLSTRGDLTDQPLIEVPADSPPLWRSGVYDTWDGRAWTTPGDLRRISGPPFAVAAPTGPTRTDDVRVERRAAGPVFAPGPVVSLEAGGRSAVVDGYGALQGSTSPGYRVTTSVVQPSVEVLRAATGPDETDPRWTALPSGLPQRVVDLGRQLAAGASSRIDVVRAVEAHLTATASYRLDSPVPGPGEDAVDRFLFVDRVGFCEQFAAAEALLLRAAGIPARFVTGVGYGVEDGDRRTYRQKDLHAWVEVFHPGFGWVPSDPTPPSTQLASASLRTRVVAELTAALRRADDVPGGRPAIAAALLALTAAVAGVLLLRRRRPVPGDRLPRVVADVRGRPALAAFLRYDARLAGRARRPAESLGELRSRLDAPPEVVAALTVVEQECYAATAPARAPEAAEVLDRA
ncbi:MAG: transglutaminase domain-containing protein [Mycobacteriales bacterium]|nr:transglutaminase domain-containing protein [Mycobacteriales bacterium]